MLTLLPFVALWLGLIAPQFYRAQIGHLMAHQVNWPAAVLFYILFIVGMVFFVTTGATILAPGPRPRRYALAFERIGLGRAANFDV